MMNFEEKYRELSAAVEALYYAAYWRPDRECEAIKLWEGVRDAAGIPAGQSYDRLGPAKQHG